MFYPEMKEVVVVERGPIVSVQSEFEHVEIYVEIISVFRRFRSVRSEKRKILLDVHIRQLGHSVSAVGRRHLSDEVFRHFRPV